MCSSGIVYSAKINGKPTTFGTSGLLYRSNKVMYDRVTNTLWSQFRGTPIVGELVGSDITLEVFPISLTTWEEWLLQHPDTEVLSLDTGYYSPSQYQPESDEKSIYFDYRNSPEPIFPVLERDDRLVAKELVLGLDIDGQYKAYPISATMANQLVHDEVNGIPLVVLGSTKSSDARAYRSQETEFSLPSNATTGYPTELVDNSGRRWIVTPEALVNESDPADTRSVLPSNVVYWFGWSGYHAETELYKP